MLLQPLSYSLISQIFLSKWEQSRFVSSCDCGKSLWQWWESLLPPGSFVHFVKLPESPDQRYVTLIMLSILLHSFLYFKMGMQRKNLCSHGLTSSCGCKDPCRKRNLAISTCKPHFWGRWLNSGTGPNGACILCQILKELYENSTPKRAAHSKIPNSSSLTVVLPAHFYGKMAKLWAKLGYLTNLIWPVGWRFPIWS